MGRNVSMMRAAGSSQAVNLIMPGSSPLHVTPRFAKAGRHPNLDGNNFQVTYLNWMLNDAMTYGSYGSWGTPGYNNTRGRMYYGLGGNYGWWDQDQGLWDVATNGWLDISNVPSNNSSYGLLTYTPRSGELGNDIINVTRSLTLLPWYVRSRNQTGAWHNFRFVNGDHPGADKRVLLQDGATLLSLDRYQLYVPSSEGWTGKSARRNLVMTTSGHTLSSQTGSASYNHTRGELAVVAATGTTGRFAIRLYAVKFDERLDVTAIDAASPVVETTVDLPSALWPRWNNEARFRVKPVLLDGGDIVLVGFHSANTTSGSEGLRAIRLTRSGTNSSTTFAPPASATASLATHGATYCMDSDSSWMGMKAMQSSSGRYVLCFTQYYYYGAGLSGFIVDRKTGTITPVSYADTTFGYSALHDDEDGFLFYRCGQDYEASGWNQTEAYRWMPRSDGSFVMWSQVPITKRIFPYNSTYTNCYPALLEVLA